MLEMGAFPIFCKYSHLPAGGQLYHKYPALLTLTGFETLSGLFLSNPINGYKKSGMLPCIYVYTQKRVFTEALFLIYCAIRRVVS